MRHHWELLSQGIGQTWLDPSIAAILQHCQRLMTAAGLSLCPDGAITGRVWVMHDDYRTRFAGDDSGFITGTTVPVDGGLAMD